MLRTVSLLVIACLCGGLIWIDRTTAFSPAVPFLSAQRIASEHDVSFFSRPSYLSSSSTDDASTTQAPAPVLNGKRVLPYKIMMAGVKGHKVAAVYAVLNSSFKRGSEGWEAAEYIGVSQDLGAALQSLHENDATELKVAHVRALSFTFPQPNAMQDVADQWRAQAKEAGASLDGRWADDVLNYLFDEEDDDDDDDDIGMTAEAMAAMSADGTIVSPFDASQSNMASSSVTTDDVPLEFTSENVDKVLDEVRPYLIADGGNVSVERVDEVTKNVYLKLEGACGSCASSTVTMQMGIERVLKEKFTDVNEILQIEDDPESKPKELSLQAVEDEVSRLKPAIFAMGGSVELESIDVETGIVNVKFQGASKVRQGLELALLDVDFVNEVNWTTADN